MPKEKSAGAVVFIKENNEIFYLLLHYGTSGKKKGGHWDFPKGHIEEGEKEIETVKREVEEETGIKDIRIIQGFKQWIKYFFKASYGMTKEQAKGLPWTFKVVVFFLAETKTKEVSISHEHVGYKWLNYNDAEKQLTHKNAKDILRKANDYLISKENI